MTGAGLGVVELTVALHHVYDTPRDEICSTLSFKHFLNIEAKSHII